MNCRFANGIDHDGVSDFASIAMSPDRALPLWSMVLEQAAGTPVTVGHVCAAVVRVTGVDGSSVALTTSSPIREAVYASDETAARVEELTLTLGEGPSIDALRLGEPVLSADMAGTVARSRWPLFASEAVAVGAQAVFALPLRIGVIHLGVLTIYRRRSGDLIRRQVSDGLALADILCLLLLDGKDPAVDTPLPEADDAEEVRYPEVHQATGMITVQLGVTAEIAFARLRAFAFAHNRRLRDVARDVVARRLRFEPDSDDDYAGGR